ncbi:hypothetical protein [Streptomyces profundus]|uniref:DUF7848 domain-containing protein n=1 Tax=Streptomyces profundus TaxID=2867410 RepID=UPI001D165990|nr:hypothetical protein [Streptomyces sp. MA3_2.13]UED83269.1 hypothetical protein K4G22_02870 [Streptomyces sp. MA3_2.13]
MSVVEPRVVKGADWILSEVRERGAPPAIQAAECMSCDARSPLVDDADPQRMAVWAIGHSQQEPEHTMFLLRTEKHWRVQHLVQGVEDVEPVEGEQAVGWFGPVFVGLMCLLTAAAGLLPALR